MPDCNIIPFWSPVHLMGDSGRASFHVTIHPPCGGFRQNLFMWLLMHLFGDSGRVCPRLSIDTPCGGFKQNMSMLAIHVSCGGFKQNLSMLAIHAPRGGFRQSLSMCLSIHAPCGGLRQSLSMCPSMHLEGGIQVSSSLIHNVWDVTNVSCYQDDIAQSNPMSVMCYVCFCRVPWVHLTMIHYSTKNCQRNYY